MASLDFEIIEFKHQFCGNTHTHTRTPGAHKRKELNAGRDEALSRFLRGVVEEMT